MALSLLTVDDEEHVHSGLDAIVDWQALGYEHSGFALNGEDALAFVERHHPDAILTDIRMPVLDGLGLVEAIGRIHGYEPVIIIISGYDEFEYAQRALRLGVSDYLLKPIDEDDLADVLTRVRDRRPSGRRAGEEEGARGFAASTLVRRLASGPPSEDLMRAATVTLGLAEAESLRYAMIVDTALDRGADTLQPVAVASAFRAGNMERCSGWNFSETPHVVGCAVPGRTGSRGRSASDELWAKGLHRLFEEAVSRPLFLVAGPLVSDASKLHESRERVLGRLQNALVVEDSGFLVLGDDPDETAPAARCGFGFEVLEAIEAADGEALAAARRRVFDALRTRVCSPRSLREWLNLLHAHLVELCTELEGTQPDELAGIESLGASVHLEPRSRVEHMLVDVTDAMVTFVRSQRHLVRHGVVLLLRRRIDRRYAEPLSLAAIAEEYGMNAVYLGQLFRTTIGKSFKEYLRERRVREAKRLLLNTDLLIPEVGAQVGFRDADYFTDQFKRVTAMTPGAFRREHSRQS